MNNYTQLQKMLYDKQMLAQTTLNTEDYTFCFHFHYNDIHISVWKKEDKSNTCANFKLQTKDTVKLITGGKYGANILLDITYILTTWLKEKYNPKLKEQ